MHDAMLEPNFIISLTTLTSIHYSSQWTQPTAHQGLGLFITMEVCSNNCTFISTKRSEVKWGQAVKDSLHSPVLFCNALYCDCYDSVIYTRNATTTPLHCAYGLLEAQPCCSQQNLTTHKLLCLQDLCKYSLFHKKLRIVSMLDWYMASLADNCHRWKTWWRSLSFRDELSLNGALVGLNISKLFSHMPTLCEGYRLYTPFHW